MNKEVFLIILGIVWILVASLQDLKKREVANWLSFSLIIFGLGYRFFWSLFSGDFYFLFHGIIGLGIFLIVGYAFYYGRVFAGGDAKLMISLGVILPFTNNFNYNLKIFFGFIGIFLLVGAVYGLFWSLFLGFINFKKLKKGMKKQFVKTRKIFISAMIFGLVVMITGLSLNILIFYLGVLFFITPFLFVYLRVVESLSLIKKMKIEDVTEGDWLNKDVKLPHSKKIIEQSWEGLTLQEIKKMKAEGIKKVEIKQGIPFVPVFLFSFLFLVWLFYRGIFNVYGFSWNLFMI